MSNLTALIQLLPLKKKKRKKVKQQSFLQPHTEAEERLMVSLLHFKSKILEHRASLNMNAGLCSYSNTFISANRLHRSKPPTAHACNKTSPADLPRLHFPSER